MSDFKPFAQSVYTRFNQMSAHELFVVDLTGDEVWEAYIGAFPDGTNRLYKTRTEFDCSCCKQVVRAIGNVVRINDVNKEPVWQDSDMTLEYPFDVVADALHALVMSKPIVGLFRASEPTYGSEVTHQVVSDANGITVGVKQWNHFHVKINSKHFLKDSGSVKGEYASAAHVFKRGLEELSPAAVQQVLDLIEANALYRGEEHKAAVQGFATMQAKYNRLKSDDSKNNLVWLNAKSTGARFRNTVIGTLVQDLSEGKDLERAVKSFEDKVAPTNYKRTTALITPKMIEAAQTTLAELGLEEAIHRRFAKLSDMSVNNVLWVDNSARAGMKDGIAGLLADQVKTTAPTAANAAQIGIEEFMSSVLPKAQAIDVLLNGQHMGNFVSVTAGDDPAKLFKWDNSFAWSYDGNVTDSIKDRVAKAGGNVTNAALRISLAWFNYDDLDIHVVQPDGERIYHGNRRVAFGHLDVDMNIGNGESRQAVENISWTRLADGPYRVMVNNYTPREKIDVGCSIEIECGGQIVQLSHAGVLKKSSTWGDAGSQIAVVHVRNGKIEKIDPAKGVVGGGFSQEKWGVKTEDFVKVQTVMFSPNFWDDQAVGNKHWFFILEGCKADMPARGIYNEFLRSDLDKHRKVFEILGDKTKCEVVDDQLSGVGFSSTRKDELTVRVKTGKIEKLYNIVF